MRISYTSPGYTVVRGRPQRERWFLAMHKPRVLMQARLDEFVDAQTITYTGMSGSIPEFQEYTGYMGSGPGLYDKGVFRARRFIGADTIKINETAASTANWQPNDYITIIEKHALWARHVKNDAYGNSSVDGEAVGLRTTEFIPQAVLGPPAVGYVGETMYFPPASYSVPYTPGATIVAADLRLPTGDWVSTLGDTWIEWVPTETYVNGIYVYLVVEDDNGQSHTTARVVWVFNRSGTVDRPMRDVSFSRISGDRNSGGYETSVKVYDPTDWDTYSPIGGLTVANVPGGNQVVIFNELESYTGTPIYHGGNWLHRENIKFWGWVLDEKLNPAPASGRRPNVTLQLGSHHKILDQIYSYAIAMEDKPSPTDWNQMVRPTSDLMQHYICNYRTTFSYVDSFHPAGLYATSEAAKYFDVAPGTIWNQMVNAYSGNSFPALAIVGIGLQGGLWADLDANVLGEDDRAIYPQVAALTDQDRRLNLEIPRRWTQPVAQCVFWGVDYDVPIGTQFPGDPVATGGQLIEMTSMIAPSQETMDDWVGNYYAKENSPYEEFPIPIRGYIIDCFPQSRISLTMDTNNMGGRLTLDNTTAWVRGFHLDPPRDGVCLATIDVELDILGLPGISIEIPVIENPPPPICQINCGPPPPPPPPTIPGTWVDTWICTVNKLYAAVDIPAPPSTAQPIIYDASNGETDFSAFAVYSWDTGFQAAYWGINTPELDRDPANIMYRSHLLDPGIPSWLRPWYVLVPAEQIRTTIAQVMWPGNPSAQANVRITQMSGLAFDINDPFRLYFTASTKTVGVTTSYAVFLMEAFFIPTGGGGWSLLSLSPAVVIGPTGLNGLEAFGGFASMCAVGAFDASKTSEWAQPNRVLGAGGNQGSAPKRWATRVFTKDGGTEGVEWSSTLITDSAGKHALLHYGFNIDPNNSYVAYFWRPSDISSESMPAQFFRVDSRLGGSSHITLTNPDHIPSNTSILDSGGVPRSSSLFGAYAIGLWSSWHPEPDTIAQTLRAFSHQKNQYVRYAADNSTIIATPVDPLGDIAINVPGQPFQCWGTAALQADQGKVYAGKMWTGPNKLGGISANPDRNHIFCIANDTGSGDITFYDRSGDPMVLRMSGKVLAVVPDWENKINPP